jgi:2-oxo-4-hydroxy-4-carboxy-5-ureidoimidazoline decarboxylase
VIPDRERLRACLGSDNWVEMMAGRDYVSLDELADTGFAAASALRIEDVEQALAAHPRIGERAQGSDAEAALSASEQSASATDDLAQAALMDRANADYESRFGRVFLIRAAGRTRAEILRELERRLTNDDASELRETAEQLRDIAVLRLRTLFADDFEETT